PLSSNFASKWFEFDPTYPVIKMLSALRIIKMAPGIPIEMPHHVKAKAA
ncbi:MAG: hypothetical protein H7Z76_01010, partial [Methylotenera sp.]|nr:hypothetical protein [Flavobacterium sp.]